ncbi:V-type proton ATPase subunit G 1-like [Tripterygium wilfordii]|uniref:V-type proton ATPase subunit G n=2 Tax=Tripterygium wilfordii TaxID=458696 RepID=A0A7J7CK80_TRIWF|nr:V-type proton ATPase subunit G 1-like [Tripterygium wilfordii]
MCNYALLEDLQAPIAHEISCLLGGGPRAQLVNMVSKPARIIPHMEKAQKKMGDWRAQPMYTGIGKPWNLEEKILTNTPFLSLHWNIIAMEANRGQNGIQLLLAAEQEAQHIVNAARNAKMARLKQAKEEADKEIAEFRAHMEAEFQRKLAESSGDSGANVKRLEHETEEKINLLKTEAARISQDVVRMLLRHVTTVKN